ncbi:unnamed protein product [Lupinus luteus]|uniref:Uncharacterized protein n=1 Tax=Lupinus luteus TaxID=3873 RepID=A0AAV1WBN8_LUPLU
MNLAPGQLKVSTVKVAQAGSLAEQLDRLAEQPAYKHGLQATTMSCMTSKSSSPQQLFKISSP